MDSLIKSLKKILDEEETGINITLDKLSIHTIYFDDELYGIIDTNSETQGMDNFIWLKFNKHAFVEYYNEELYENIKDSLINKKGVYISEGNAFFNDICIEGLSSKFEINLKTKVLKVVGIDIKQITSASDDWKKGIFGIESEKGENHYQISDGMKHTITQVLEPYINEPSFAYLRRKLSEQISSKEQEPEIIMIHCEKCHKPDIYHIIEIVNGICNPDYCRECGDAKFPSISKVPFSTAFLVNLYEYFNIFIRHIDQCKTPSKEITKNILPFVRLENRVEMGVVFDYVRNLSKKLFEKNSYDLMKELDHILEEVKRTNLKEYKKLIGDFNSLSSLQSLQATSDIVETAIDIEEKSKESFMKLFYPHPLLKVDGSHIYSEKDVVHDNVTNIANLYKDVFDLVSDHKFIANLGRILKGQKYNENCITDNLYGVRLLNETKKNIKGTNLYELVNGIYNSKIRNAIAHPGRYIDKNNNQVKIFNKGNLEQTMTIEEFLLEIDKLVLFHKELTQLKYRAALKEDANFLSTGGILSFEIEFFTKEGDKERPHIIINQLYPYKEFSPGVEWWKDAIIIKPIFESEGNGLSISVNREPSLLTDSSPIRKNDYALSPHLKEWIEMVIDQKEIVVTHRYCHIPVDITERDEELQWIPIDIYVYDVDEEHEYFIQYMEYSGNIKLSDESIHQLEQLIV